MNIALDRNNNVVTAASQQPSAVIANLNEAPLVAAVAEKDTATNDTLAPAQAPNSHSNVRVQAGNGQTQILDSSNIGNSGAEFLPEYKDLDPKIISTAKKLKLTNEQLKNLIESSTNDELIKNLAEMAEKSLRR